MPERTDEFYIGYLPQAPPGHAARTRMAVLGVLILAAGLALILVTGQERFGTGVFEFGITKDFAGVVLERPYPMLLVQPDGGEGSFSSRKWGHRRKMDEAIRGEFSKVSGLA